jgi:hypothetical protein
MARFEVWVEGYAATGNIAKAQQLIGRHGTPLWEAPTFEEACVKALRALGWDMKYYDKKENSYWGCTFYDNEEDARRYFG